MTPAGVGPVAASAAVWLGAQNAGGSASLGTLVGIALYAGIAWAATRLAVRRAEAALGGRPDDAAPSDRDRRTGPRSAGR